MVGEDAAGMRQMLDRVAGMDDIEAPTFQRHVFDAGEVQFAALQTGARLRHAFIRFDRDERRVGSLVQQGMGEAAAIGADVEKREGAGRMAVAQHGVESDPGAESLAVAHISPIRAA